MKNNSDKIQINGDQVLGAGQIILTNMELWKNLFCGYCMTINNFQNSSY